MKNHLRFIRRCVEHQLRANRLAHISDPRALEIVQAIQRRAVHPAVVREIESRRRTLLMSDVSIDITDFGAGSAVLKGPTRRVRDMAKVVLKSVREAQALHSLVAAVRPNTMLELGTSFGITTLYIAAAHSSGHLTTIEGDPRVAAIAHDIFRSARVSNIEPIIGTFEDELPQFLHRSHGIDMVFFDGNHRKEPTLRYFYQCLEKAGAQSVFVFDDIYWSEGMEEAWQTIQAHPSVTVSLDFFFFGIVLFNSTTAHRSYRLRL